MKKLSFLFVLMLAMMSISCFYKPSSSDDLARRNQEQILAQGNAEIGMPAITNFREKRMLKTIFELRDDEGYATFTYLYSDMTGKFIYIGPSIGYPIPYSTQFTNPQKFGQDRLPDNSGGRLVDGIIQQADPNGLFAPSSSNATWVVLIDPSGKAVPTFFEPDLVCLPYKLPGEMLIFVPPNY